MHVWALNAGNAVNLCQLGWLASGHLRGLFGAAEDAPKRCFALHMWGICYAHLAGFRLEAVQAEAFVSCEPITRCCGLLRACTPLLKYSQRAHA